MAFRSYLSAFRSNKTNINKFCSYLTEQKCHLSTKQGSNVGFVGLGNMGSHMARNLIAKGHSVTVYDIFPESVEQLVKSGATGADSPQDLADKVDTIVTMLPSNDNVKEVYIGDNGILKTVKSETLLIDSSTIDPSVSQSVAASADKAGVSFVDAPVSGGTLAAQKATLTFMVGGTDKAFERAKPFLECMGQNVMHCGRVGSGQAAKICNNMLLAICMIGTSEAMNLGVRLGLDPKLLAKVLNSSSGRCWSSDIYNPVPGVMPGVPSSNGYDGGFASALMAKDLGLAQDASTRTRSPTPLGSAAHQIYRILSNGEYSKKDFSVIYKFLHEMKQQK